MLSIAALFDSIDGVMRLFDTSLNEGDEFIGQRCYLASSDVAGVLERNEELRGGRGHLYT
jgi:hypothetical protein